MPFNGASSEAGPPGPAPLVAVGQLLAERGMYGLVWFGDDFVVQATFGRLVAFAAVGEPLLDTLFALVGLEADILALKTQPAGDILDLPDVTLVTPEGRRPRFNLSVFWSATEQAFVVLVARTGARSELEIELTRQMRARLMAEAEVSAKSRALEKANAELARANSDLESFASIISHDLQSPMRALRYMVDDLEMKLSTAGGPNRPDLTEQLDALRAQSRRMTGMLRALLDYSSVTRKADAIEAVDTSALIDSIVTTMALPPRFGIDVAGQWPVIETLAAPLDLVLRNLIDNAVKHHDRDTGHVRISVEASEMWLTIFVNDDGPGIAPEHREAVFLPFRRLSGLRETPGEGMGLALVRRTVEGVGGAFRSIVRRRRDVERRLPSFGRGMSPSCLRRLEDEWPGPDRLRIPAMTALTVGHRLRRKACLMARAVFGSPVGLRIFCSDARSAKVVTPEV